MKKLSKPIILSILMIVAILQTPVSVFAKDLVLPSGFTLGEFDTASEKYIDQHNIADAAVAFSIVTPSKILHESIQGFANKEQQIAADSDTIYEWGSLTKILTWVSVMQLYEQEKLDLSADIRTYLPKDFFQKLSFNTPITMQDLMNHTGGWEDSITNVYTDDASEIVSLHDYLTQNEHKQLYEPGKTVAYSNWGVTLAGYIVERISGEEYCQYVRNHIFLPLGMNTTSIDPLRRDNEAVKNGLANVVGYTTTGSKVQGHYYAPDYPAASAAGTLKDVELFAQALLSLYDCTLFEKSETLLKMLETTAFYEGTDIPRNAHGLWYDFYRTPSLGHNGNTVQFTTHLSLSPTDGIGMIVLTNQAQESALCQGLGNYVFGEYQGEQTDSTWPEYSFYDYYVSAKTIQNGYCKFYNAFQVYQISQCDNDRLQLRSLFSKINCTRVKENCFRVTDGPLEGYQFYVAADENHVVQKVSTCVFDIVPCSSAFVIADRISFVLAGMILILSVLSLILCTRMLIKKRGKRIFFPLFMSVCSLLFYVLVMLEALALLTTAASTKDMIPYALFYLTYLVATLVYGIRFFVTRQKDPVKTLVLISCMFLSAFILYWEMFFIH